MAWIQCCICGRKMELENGTLLFKGTDEKRRYACRNCAQNIASNDETVRFNIGESPFLNASNDAELYDFLDDMGIVTAAAVTTIKEEKKTVRQISEDAQETQENQMTHTSVKTSSTGWITLIRTIMWLVIIVGFLASIVCGCLIGEESGWLGFLVIIVGILLTLILAAATMIFLDMADDIHAIRQKLDKM